MLVMNIQTSGYMQPATATRRSAWMLPRLHTHRHARTHVALRSSDRRCVLGATAPSSVVIVHPPLAHPELDDGQREDDRKEDPGEGAGVAHAEELEGLAEQVVGEEERGIERTAPGHHVGFRENLHRADEAHNRIE